MRHGISGRKFGRDTAQRKSLFVNLAKSLLRYEHIVTTLPKAKDLRPYVEKMLTLGKKGGIPGRRNLFAKLRDEELVSKVFGPLASRYAARNGGYTRIVKCGFRRGDMAPIALIELLDRDGAGAAAAMSSDKGNSKRKGKATASTSAPALKTDAKAEGAANAEATAAADVNAESAAAKSDATPSTEDSTAPSVG
jgi:large subunit ribosomal protein L17